MGSFIPQGSEKTGAQVHSKKSQDKCTDLLIEPEETSMNGETC